MARLRIQFLHVREALSVALATGVLLWGTASALHAVPGKHDTSPKATGSYRVMFSGWAKGTGNASVGPNNLNVTATLVDKTGVSLNLQATINLENSRFHGTGTLNGVVVDLSGRVDPPDDTLTAPRLMGTYRTETGKVGRLVGMQSPTSKGKGKDD